MDIEKARRLDQNPTRTEQLRSNILLAQQGNELAFSAVVESLWKPMIRRASLGGKLNPEDTEDVTAVTFFDIWKKISYIDLEKYWDPSIYILRSAANQSLKRLKENRKDSEFCTRLDENGPFQPHAGSESDPLKTAISQETLREVNQIVEELPDKYARVVRQFMRGFTTKELAGKLGMSRNESTLKVQLHRGLLKVSEDIKHKAA